MLPNLQTLLGLCWSLAIWYEIRETSRLKSFQKCQVSFRLEIPLFFLAKIIIFPKISAKI